MWTPLLVLASMESVLALGEDDLVADLPGLIFETNFKVYSGYVNANDNGTWKMYYFLAESQNNPATDPLILFLDGGPGCASSGLSLSVAGPFHANHGEHISDRPKTLFENIYAWNQHANLMFFDSPIGVGFSYDTQQSNVSKSTDELAAQQNYAALKDFFGRVQPRFKNTSFFISGESYAGVYLPMLADQLVKGINAGDFTNNNFQGVAIGNGYMDTRTQTNSLIPWQYYHGRISPDDWNMIKRECCKGGDIDDCDYFQYWTTTNGLKYHSDGSKCGNLTAPWLSENHLPGEVIYNIYQDCYDMTAAQWDAGRPPTSALTSGNYADLWNYDTTDANFGFYCWGGTAKMAWLRETEVMKSLHIADDWIAIHKTIESCNDPMYSNWNDTNRDTSQFLLNVLRDVKTKNFRILSYNGDVDTVCNYLGNAWFMRKVAFSATPNMTVQKHDRWYFRDQVGGFVQRYKAANGNYIDALTVKGAGHNVPEDRPGPALQMITNFMLPPPGLDDNAPAFYSSNASINVRPTPRPLKSNTGTTSAGTQPTTTGTAELSFNVFLLCCWAFVAVFHA